MTAVGHGSAGARTRRGTSRVRIAARGRSRITDPARLPVRVPRWLGAAVIVGDTVAVIVALAASQFIFPTHALPDLVLGPSGAALAWPVLLAARGCYTRVGLVARDSQQQIGRAVVTLVALFAVVSAVAGQSVAMTTVVVVGPLLFAISMATRRGV